MLSLMFVVLLGGPTAPPAACDWSDGLITAISVGPLRIGEATLSLRRRCPAVRDTLLLVPLFEQTRVDSVKALVGTVRGAPVVAVEKNGRIGSLTVSNEGPATADGIAVGSSIARFRRMRGVEITAGDRTADIPLTVKSRCGIIFLLSGWGPTRSIESAAAQRRSLARRVMVTGGSKVWWMLMQATSSSAMKR